MGWQERICHKHQKDRLCLIAPRIGSTLYLELQCGVRVLIDAPGQATIVQCHLLQERKVDIKAKSKAEDAILVVDGFLYVLQDNCGIGLP